MIRGLGAFVSGAMQGYQFGENIKDNRADRARRDKIDGITEEQRQMDNARRKRIDEINEEQRQWENARLTRADATAEEQRQFNNQRALRLDELNRERTELGMEIDRFNHGVIKEERERTVDQRDEYEEAIEEATRAADAATAPQAPSTSAPDTGYRFGLGRDGSQSDLTSTGTALSFPQSTRTRGAVPLDTGFAVDGNSRLTPSPATPQSAGDYAYGLGAGGSRSSLSGVGSPRLTMPTPAGAGSRPVIGADGDGLVMGGAGNDDLGAVTRQQMDYPYSPASTEARAGNITPGGRSDGAVLPPAGLVEALPPRARGAVQQPRVTDLPEPERWAPSPVPSDTSAPTRQAMDYPGRAPVAAPVMREATPPPRDTSAPTRQQLDYPFDPASTEVRAGNITPGGKPVIAGEADAQTGPLIAADAAAQAPRPRGAIADPGMSAPTRQQMDYPFDPRSTEARAGNMVTGGRNAGGTPPAPAPVSGGTGAPQLTGGSAPAQPERRWGMPSMDQLADVVEASVRGLPNKDGTFSPKQAERRARGAIKPDQAKPIEPKAAEKTGKDWLTHFRENGVPQIERVLITQGRLEEAEQWNTWSKGKGFEKGMELYGQAAFYAARGDMEGFAATVVDLYNDEDYFSDGITVNKDETMFVRDENGNLAGARVTFVGPDGDEWTETWESMDDLAADVLNMLAPEKAFELRLAQQEAAPKAAKEAQEAEAERREATRKRVGEVVSALAEENLGQWAKMTPEEKAQMVRERIAMEDAVADAAMGASPTQATGAPPVLRRP